MIATLGDWTLRTSDEPATAEEAALSVRYRLTNIDRWHSPATTRVRIIDVPDGDGAFNPVRSHRSAKTMRIEGIVEARDAETAEYECWERIAALAPEGLPLTLLVESNGQTRSMRVWLSGDSDVIPFTATKARFKIPVVAADPRKYGPPQALGPVAVAGSADDGLTFPLFADGYLDFGDFAPSGLVEITNQGRARSWPIFRVRGSLDSAGFRILSGSDSLEYAAAVPLGTEITLSPYAGGRATIGDTDVTTNLTSATWPSIGPGETRTFVFLALGTADGNARMIPIFSDAWW